MDWRQRALDALPDVLDSPVVTAVVRTLRYTAQWREDDRSRRAFVQLAQVVEAEYERGDVADWCCPICQEVECDDDCPLAVIRGTA